MLANTSPIYPYLPKVSWGLLTEANTAKNGVGTVETVFTAGPNGSRVDFLKVRGLGTNTDTVLRVFLNNGNTNVTALNNTLIMEQTIAATTLSEVASLVDNIVTLNISIPPGYKINCTVGTSVVAGLYVTAFGGDY
jgi:hypothetical protein